jgi:MFS family permease
LSENLITLGLRANWRQFALLAIINAFVGSMVGMERSTLPLIAKEEYGLASQAVILSFLVSFGVVKALSNLLAGSLSDRLGRKRILVAGWVAGLLVPFLIILAPNWGWVVFANVLLGINQGLCWSATVIMKIDLVGPRQRGLAMGLNEFAGYIAVSLSALLTGYLAATYGLHPVPFYPGIGFAVLGLLLSAFFVIDTRDYAHHEAQVYPLASNNRSSPVQTNPSFAQILLLTSWKDRTLFAVSQAGLVNNLNDALVWGLVPIFLTDKGVPLGQISLIAALYPGVWGIGQLLTGFLSDRWGRKGMISVGMWIQAIGIGLFVVGKGFIAWVGGAVLLGIGTALVYPTLLATVSDVAHPQWRASSVGVYRLWRDAGYAFGGLLSGILADAIGIPFAMLVIAALTFLSGIIVSAVMYETLPASDSAVRSGKPDQPELGVEAKRELAPSSERLPDQ